MFVQLNKQFPSLQYSEGAEAVSYGGIISYLYLNKLSEDVLGVIPKKYQDSFSVSLMKISGEVPPHTDSSAKTVINFYIQSGNYKTVFFDGSSPTYQVENQTNGHVYDRNGLTEKESFVAKDGDVFCLNVARTHAVDSLDGNPTERIAVCVSTGEYEFEQVCNMLSDTKYIN